MAVAAVGALLPIRAEAVVQYGSSTYYFDASNHVVGQSILYCDNKPYHWGISPQGNSISIRYSCDTTTAVSLAFPPNMDPVVRNAFCAESGACEVGPYPYPGSPPLERGY
ncbi:hypothetical protein EC912_107142 [Luteibacter rhizovicinus]|uniref:Uncharacterized protein n=2 Tax=Luteibacter rhizovicinus TaxID=242606 RepID=A0A4R3YMT8_9GAMM|nr:hypothetical protein EC912_107142 [Luteibacter rhizovicinus]